MAIYVEIDGDHRIKEEWEPEYLRVEMINGERFKSWWAPDTRPMRGVYPTHMTRREQYPFARPQDTDDDAPRKDD